MLYSIQVRDSFLTKNSLIGGMNERISTWNVREGVISRKCLSSCPLKRSRCCWAKEKIQSTKHLFADNPLSVHLHHLIFISVIIIIIAVTTKYILLSCTIIKR